MSYAHCRVFFVHLSMNWLESREKKAEEDKKKDEVERKKAQDLQSLKHSLLKRLEDIIDSTNSIDLQSSNKSLPSLFKNYQGDLNSILGFNIKNILQYVRWYKICKSN